LCAGEGTARGTRLRREGRGARLRRRRGARSRAPSRVELKRVFGLGLVLQGVDRLALTDSVYLAVGQWPKKLKDVKKLCRRLGLGLLVVAGERADVVLDPAPYAPRKNKRKVGRL